jgi:LysR family transcriptional regulator, nitrogen assimilation regulatory protein
LNSKQLEYFLKIAELGSYRRASELLRIAQPALTRQIKMLERELGVELFNRHSDGVTATSAGALLLERARFIVSQTEQARADVMAEGTIPRGTVAFGAPPSIAGALFCRLSQVYLSLYPDVKLRFYEGVGHLANWLTSNEIDLAILPNSRLADVRNFNLRSFVGETVYLVGPPGEFAPGSRCGIEAVVERPLVLTTPPSTVRGWLDQFVERGGRLRIVAETESLNLQHSFVQAGLGYALLPHSAVSRSYAAGAVSLCRVEGWSLTRVLAWRNDRPLTPAVRCMVELTEQEMTKLLLSGAFGVDPAGCRAT